mgnify:CR=1 FL=1
MKPRLNFGRGDGGKNRFIILRNRTELIYVNSNTKLQILKEGFVKEIKKCQIM